MSLKSLIQNLIVKTALQETVDKLLEKSTLQSEFFIYLFLSSGIATFGMLENNMAIIIGAMVIAPLLIPLLCLSLGGLSFKPKMIRFGLSALILGSILGMLTAAAIVLILDRSSVPGEMIDLYTFHNYDFIAIAFLSGMAGAYSSLAGERSEQIVGVAIAVALIPPLTFAGIALGIKEFLLFKDTVILYLLNLLSTSTGAAIVYSVFLTKHKVNTEEIEE